MSEVRLIGGREVDRAAGDGWAAITLTIPVPEAVRAGDAQRTMNAGREFREDLPPVLRAWFDWTATSLSGWSKCPQIAAWALRSLFLPAMTGVLTASALVVLWPLAYAGQILSGLARFSKPKGKTYRFAPVGGHGRKA